MTRVLFCAIVDACGTQIFRLCVLCSGIATLFQLVTTEAKANKFLCPYQWLARVSSLQVLQTGPNAAFLTRFGFHLVLPQILAHPCC